MFSIYWTYSFSLVKQSGLYLANHIILLLPLKKTTQKHKKLSSGRIIRNNSYIFVINYKNLSNFLYLFYYFGNWQYSIVLRIWRL